MWVARTKLPPFWHEYKIENAHQIQINIVVCLYVLFIAFLYKLVFAVGSKYIIKDVTVAIAIYLLHNNISMTSFAV